MVTVIDFYADWCGPCKLMDPIIHELEEEMKDSVKFEKVDVDKETEKASQFGVMSIPTYVVLKDGKEAGRVIGYMPKAQFKQKIEEHI